MMAKARVLGHGNPLPSTCKPYLRCSQARPVEHIGGFFRVKSLSPPIVLQVQPSKNLKSPNAKTIISYCESSFRCYARLKSRPEKNDISVCVARILQLCLLLLATFSLANLAECIDTLSIQPIKILNFLVNPWAKFTEFLRVLQIFAGRKLLQSSLRYAMEFELKGSYGEEEETERQDKMANLNEADDGFTLVGGFYISRQNEGLVKMILSQHPTVAEKCKFKSAVIRGKLMDALARAVAELQVQSKSSVDIELVQDCIEYVERQGFQVPWLRNRMKQLRLDLENDHSEMLL